MEDIAFKFNFFRGGRESNIKSLKVAITIKIQLLKSRSIVILNLVRVAVSSVARGGGRGGAGAPPLACEVCKIACFLWF